MTPNHIHQPGKEKPGVSMPNIFKQKSCLVDGIVPMDSYSVERNIGHATIILSCSGKQTYRPEDMLDKISLSVNLKGNIKTKIENKKAFEEMLKRITNRVMERVCGTMVSCYGGHINFESAYRNGTDSIFVFEYKMKAKMKTNSDNVPIRAIVSGSEACDIDALRIYKEMIEAFGKDRVFLSLKDPKFLVSIKKNVE